MSYQKSHINTFQTAYAPSYSMASLLQPCRALSTWPCDGYGPKLAVEQKGGGPGGMSPLPFHDVLVDS